MEIKGTDEALQRHEARMQEFIRLEPKQVLEQMEETFGATDIVVGGYDHADALNAGECMSMLAILRLRDTLECVSLWLENRFSEQGENAAAAGEEDL